MTTLSERDDREATSAHERRCFPRHAFEAPLLGIPILPDGTPDWEHRCGGPSVNLSLGGMCAEFEGPNYLDTRAMVVIVQGPTQPLGCAGLEARHTRRVAPGRIEMGGSF